MSEQGWDEGSEGPPKKRGIPGWLWFCGGGCLLLIVIGIAGAVWFGKTITEGMDSEKQWPRLAEALPFDERPPHQTLAMGWHLLVDAYVLQDDRGYALIVFDIDPGKAEEFAQIFDPSFQGGSGPMGMGGMENAQHGQLELQGRTVPVLRFFNDAPAGGGEEAGPQVGRGQAAFVDVTPEGHPGMVPVQIVRSAGGEEPLSDEEIRKVLAGFRIGPDYVPPAPEEYEPQIEEPPVDEPPPVEGGGEEDGR